MVIFFAQITHKDMINIWGGNLATFKVNFRIYVLFCIFVKKQGFNSFSSIGRVKIFSSKSRKIFVKRQPHLLNVGLLRGQLPGILGAGGAMSTGSSIWEKSLSSGALTMVPGQSLSAG